MQEKGRDHSVVYIYQRFLADCRVPGHQVHPSQYPVHMSKVSYCPLTQISMGPTKLNSRQSARKSFLMRLELMLPSTRHSGMVGRSRVAVLPYDNNCMTGNRLTPRVYNL